MPAPSAKIRSAVVGAGSATGPDGSGAGAGAGAGTMRRAGGSGGAGLARPRAEIEAAARSTSAGPTFPAIMSRTVTITPGGVLRTPLFHRLIFLSLVRNHWAARRWV